MSRYLSKNTKTGDFNQQRTMCRIFGVYREQTNKYSQLSNYIDYIYEHEVIQKPISENKDIDWFRVDLYLNLSLQCQNEQISPQQNCEAAISLVSVRCCIYISIPLDPTYLLPPCVKAK